MPARPGRLRVALLALALLLAAAAWVSASAAEEPDLGRYAGRWVHVWSAEESAAHAAAIERSVSGMNFALRPLARFFLKRDARPAPRIDLRPAGAAIRVERAGQASYRLPLDGLSHEQVERDGTRTRRSAELTADALVIRYRSEGSRGESVYRLAPEGDRLSVRQTIGGENLPEPLVFEATYRREEAQ